MATSERRIGLIIVGDEILSGRRQDKHFGKVIEMLGERGLKLSWAEFLGDERDELIAAYKRSFASGDIVFSCGGIGGTPDDHTRQAAAAALRLPLELHPEAKEAITLRTIEMAAKDGRPAPDMNTPENQQRLQMGVFPKGCEIVPNPFNRIPGFFIKDHTFVPGFPVMAWPMLEWTLDTRYRHLHHVAQHAEHAFLVYGLPESRITPAMEEVERRWPGVRAFSLPSVGEDGGRPHIELGVKGEPGPTAEALAYLRGEVERLGGQMTPAA
jgi:molybdopterin-biosynthesis enzyme MoeA-like protein